MVKKSLISYDARSFILDGNRVFLTSGSIHYFRVPRELWRDRLEKAKSFGLNCIQTYIAWNLHEPREGEYRFDEEADLDGFFSLCNEMGFYVIARPGPYICAEWDFGGFPAWLLTKPGVMLRHYDPIYLRYVDRWFDRLLPRIAKHQYTQGGSVILLQLENELDNIHLAEDEAQAYVTHLETLACGHGIEIPLITCAGSRSGLIECINSHTPADQTEQLRATQPDSPLFSTEFYPGWYTTWHEPVDRDPHPGEKVEYETWRFLASGASGYNYYMWHGGTNFGYNTMYLQTTSYDFFAPLSEAGGPVKKFRDLSRPARFANSFASLLADSEPIHAGHVVRRDGDIIARLRKNENAKFLFVENAGDRKRKIDIEIPGFSKEPLVLGSRKMRTVVSGVNLGSGFSISECSLPVLGLFQVKQALVLAVEAIDGRLRLRIPKDARVSTDAAIRRVGQYIDVYGELQKNRMFARLDLKTGNQHLIVVIVSPSIDNRVWPTTKSVVIGASYARCSDGKTEVHFTAAEQEAWLISPNTTKKIQPKKLRVNPPKIIGWKYAPGDSEALPETDDSDWLESYRPVNRDWVGSHCGYAWYRCWTEENRAVEREITFSALADRAVIYVNGRHVHTTTEPPEDRRVQPSATVRVRLRKGVNLIAVLSDNLGHVKGDWQLGDTRKDDLKMHDDHKGLIGPVYLSGQEMHFWRFRDRLEGEQLGRPEGHGEWKRLPRGVKGTLRWFKADFNLSAAELHLGTQAPLRIRVEGLTKGVLWVNGKDLGRYWTVNGHLEYYVPTPWLQKQNTLVLFEEGTGNPRDVRFVFDRNATSASVVKLTA
ncbi:MAG: beta-galactosidase [bacterium]